jgi:hypothetical protein
MSDPILPYQSAPTGTPTRLRKNTSTSLFVLGVFHTLTGPFLGFMVVEEWSIERRFGWRLPLVLFWLAGWAVGMLFTGISYLWASAGIKQFSHKAALMAWRLSLVNWIFSVGALGFAIPGISLDLWAQTSPGLFLLVAYLLMNTETTRRIAVVLREDRERGAK